MLLRNFASYLTAMPLGTYKGTPYPRSTGGGEYSLGINFAYSSTLKAWDLDKYISQPTSNPGTRGPSGLYVGTLKIHIGSGTTPPTIDDYCLQTPYSDSDFSGSNAVITQNTSKPTEVIFSILLTNKTNEPKTINEVGLSMQMQDGINISYMLICRSVLSNPKIVPAGSFITLNISIDFNKFVDNVSNT